VTGILAVLGFCFALVWPSLGPRLQLLRDAPEDPALHVAHGLRSPAAETDGGPASEGAPADEAVAGGGNVAPVVESVTIRGRAPVTAANDLRLDVAATDADGDPVQVRARWTINDRALETEHPILPRAHIRRGDRIGVVVVAHDGSSESAPFAVPAMAVDNADPAIFTFPSGFDASGAFVYAIGAVDPDGDADLQYRLVQGPAGMQVGPRDGSVRWLPSAHQTGMHAVEVEVRDGRGGSARQAFDLRVQRAPAPASSLADRGLAP